MKIDAHQHFWKYNSVKDSWITEEMKVLAKDFLPEDVLPALSQHNISGVVAVQADQSEAENHFLLECSTDFEFIKGIVGWVNLRDKDIEADLEKWKEHKIMKGFRHILQAEKDKALMVDRSFKRGVSKLANYGFTYDILIKYDQLVYVENFISDLPNQLFVLDHCGKPNIREKELLQWKKEILKLGKFENLFCKISGLVTEAHWLDWKYDDISMYLDIVVDAFGTDRIMFGSDWPVCLLASGYSRTFSITERYFAPFSESEKDAVFGRNAITFYNL